MVGRDDELAAIDALLVGAAAGLSGALVVEGEPGVGKTALLDHAARSAAGVQVAAVAGIESEMALDHAALHRLLLPFLNRWDELPGPQASALGTAFGLVDGPPPDRFLVGLAALTLLADAAGERPLLCVVDDVQWLDQESREVLAFVARRLYAEGLVVLFGVRVPSEEPVHLDGLATTTLSGLEPDAAIGLLASAAGSAVAPDVGAQLAALTLGNPLALVELATELSAEQLGGTALLPEPLPLGHQLEERYLHQVRSLPAPTQTVALLAASDTSGDPEVLWRAAAELDVDREAVRPLEGGDLLTLHPQVRFRHPLVRSALLAGASPEERRRAHGALAAVTDPERDPDRRAWHRAGAVSGPDEAVAAELESAADRAQTRGGLPAAGSLLLRSARLSPDAGDRGRRLLAAAQAHLGAGDPGRARLLLGEARPDITGQAAQARALRLDGTIRLATGQVAEAPPVLLDAARALGRHDARLARDTLLDASSAAIYGGRAARGTALVAVADAARSVPLPPGTAPTPGDLLLDGFASLFTDGHAVAAPLLRRAVAAVADDNGSGDQALRWLGFGCWAAGALADNEMLRRLAGRLVQASRDRGALVELTRGLYFLAMGDLVAGDLASAGAHFAENRGLMLARGGGPGLGEVIALAWQGQGDATRHEAEAVAAVAEARGQAGLGIYTEHAVVVLELGRGHYEAALAAAQRVDEEDSYFLGTVALPDLVEAAVRSGRPQAAREPLARTRERAEVNATPLALGLAARAEALLAGDDAEDLHRRAIDLLGEVPAEGHRARARLLYGEWLRRRSRRVDARRQLREAHEALTGIGATGFAERARVELLATGERARRRAVDTTDDLTPQEAKVAELAAQGSTNREIAAQLFISPGTVDYHLRKVFRKLDVSSRRRLPEALARRPG